MKTINEILQLADTYEKECLVKLATIRKLPSGKYRVLSEKGKNLGTSNSKSKAIKRLRQVEYFKHKDNNNSKDKKTIDLTKADELSYSAILRQLRQNAEKEQVLEFMRIFKSDFDRAVKNKLQDPGKIALQNSLITFNKKYPIKINKDIVKNATISELGDPALVGKYLSDIVKFTLNRISLEKRPNAINNLKNKFYSLNVNEIATKRLPASSAIGQSITFVKHVLFNHNPQYIREVINSLVKNL